MGDKDYPEVMTPEQAAEYLQLHITTVYKKLKDGSLPGGKVVGQWRLLKSELNEMIRGRKGIRPAQPIHDRFGSAWREVTQDGKRYPAYTTPGFEEIVRTDHPLLTEESLTDFLRSEDRL